MSNIPIPERTRSEIIYDQFLDIVSSGQSDFNDWHENEIKELFEEMTVTQPEMVELMDSLYGPDSHVEGCTFNEVRFMMELSGLTEYTIKLTSIGTE